MELINERREAIKTELRECINNWDGLNGLEGFEAHILPKVIEMGLEWDGCEWFHNSIMSRVWIPTDEVQLEINLKEGNVVFRSRA
jgi:hypothetical protein